ncbi:hypothetical protein [Sphingobium sp. YR657]|uniref:hypothetical protein n=1 Tax=Sphingobium sp. YR657 TaxID=1884366 RepID=UPI003137CFFC
MRLVGMTNFRNSLLSGVAMTAAERRVGRFMRAPDHPADPAPAADPAAPAAADPATPPADPAVPPADPAPSDPAAPAAADPDDSDETALGGGKKPDADPDKPADAPADPDDAPAHVVPEAYELTPPEGLTIDADLLAEATPIFKEAGLSNDQAQAILPAAKSLMEKTQNATVQALIDSGNQQRKAWLDAAKADEQIGGNKWDASLASSAKALDALGHPEGSDFRKALNETGFGNHPEMIRIFARLGEMVGEDGDFVRADAGAKVTDTLSDMYPNNRRGK